MASLQKIDMSAYTSVIDCGSRAGDHNNTCFLNCIASAIYNVRHTNDLQAKEVREFVDRYIYLLRSDKESMYDLCAGTLLCPELTDDAKTICIDANFALQIYILEDGSHVKYVEFAPEGMIRKVVRLLLTGMHYRLMVLQPTPLIKEIDVMRQQMLQQNKKRLDDMERQVEEDRKVALQFQQAEENLFQQIHTDSEFARSIQAAC